MRSFKSFIADVVRKPPIIFPLVALFHVLWLLWTLWSDHNEPFPGIVWLEVVWMIGYTTFWLAACDLRRWGAIGYVVLTILNGCLSVAARNGKLPIDYCSNMFELDGLFSIVILFYYKRFK